MSELWDYPNTQVVRADQSAPWDEGSGGAAPSEPSLSSMTKAELLEHAEAQGVEVDDSMTKAEITEAIEAG